MPQTAQLWLIANRWHAVSGTQLHTCWSSTENVMSMIAVMATSTGVPADSSNTPSLPVQQQRYCLFGFFFSKPCFFFTANSISISDKNNNNVKIATRELLRHPEKPLVWVFNPWDWGSEWLHGNRRRKKNKHLQHHPSTTQMWMLRGDTKNWSTNRTHMICSHLCNEEQSNS